MSHSCRFLRRSKILYSIKFLTVASSLLLRGASPFGIFCQGPSNSELVNRKLIWFFRLPNNNQYDRRCSYPVILPIKILFPEIYISKSCALKFQRVLGDVFIWWSYVMISAKNSLLEKNCQKATQLLKVDLI